MNGPFAPVFRGKLSAGSGRDRFLGREEKWKCFMIQKQNKSSWKPAEHETTTVMTARRGRREKVMWG